MVHMFLFFNSLLAVPHLLLLIFWLKVYDLNGIYLHFRVPQHISIVEKCKMHLLLCINKLLHCIKCCLLYPFCISVGYRKGLRDAFRFISSVLISFSKSRTFSTMQSRLCTVHFLSNYSLHDLKQACALNYINRT